MFAKVLNYVAIAQYSFRTHLVTQALHHEALNKGLSDDYLWLFCGDCVFFLNELTTFLITMPI